MEFYEIHRYDDGIFQYVVTRTNKYSKHKVREDVDRMNQMLTEALKSKGTWYEFVVGSTSDQTKPSNK
jgi:gamma-glutamylcysteine synthetase